MALKRENFSWKNRPVLVTGGAGFIGYALATALVRKGARVVVLDVKPALPSFIFGAFDARKRISYVRGTITSKKTVDTILKRKKIQTVFHLAAEAIVRRANEHPVRTFEANARGTWILLESARGAKNVQEIVVASSDKAYGSHDRLPYREGAALQGLNPYDCSKSCTDLIAQMYAHAFELPIGIVRSGNVYGPGDTNWSRLVPDAFRCAARGRTLGIRSDGSFKRDYNYIDDIVRGYVTLASEIRRKHLKGEAFNFGAGKPLRVLEVLETIQKLAPSLHYKVQNTAFGEIRHQYLNAAKARRILGWSPRTNLRDGFRKTASWYAQYFSKS